MKKLLCVMMILALLAMPLLASAEVTKDETVYVLLAADGAEKGVRVVSHIDTPEAGTYIDYGAYEAIAAMVADIEPAIDGDAITWELPASAEGFYAAGIPEDAEAPYHVTIAYMLDGAAIAPEALAGQSGAVAMTITVTPNPAAAETFRTRYAAQVQAPLSLAVASGIDAPGATTTLVGQTCTLAYTVLPGQTATYTATFDAVDFAMDSITIACAPMDMAAMLGIEMDETEGEAQTIGEGIGALTDGGQQIAEALVQLAEGSQALADNATALTDGVEQLADGVAELGGGMQALADGAQTLTDSATGYIQGAGSVLGGVTQLSDGLGTLAGSGEALAASVAQVQEGLTPLLASLPEAQRTELAAQLAALVEGVTTYTQGVSAVATQAGAMAEGAAPLAEGTDALTQGLAQQNEAIATIAASTGQLTAAAEDGTPAPVDALRDGAKQAGEGIASLNDGLQAIAPEMAKLAEGQSALLDGMGGVLDMLDTLPMDAAGETPSFVSEGHTARSVQFVYRTDAIAVAAEEAAVEAEAETQGFWDRLVGLFK